jgi:hypothetical protein
MGSQPADSVTTSADMLEEIAAINHLAVADVVWLFLVEALPEGGLKVGTLEPSPASPRRLRMKKQGAASQKET